MILCNLHTHTVFCDGKNTPEEMAEAANRKGFKLLGFSSHTAYPFASNWHINTGKIGDYKNEINALKLKYKGIMDIFYGFEADYIEGLVYPDRRILAPFSPDFIIGSVHYVPSRKKGPAPLMTVDDTGEEVARWLRECFDNNEKQAVKAYFTAVKKMVRDCKFDIVAHADLIKKRNKVLSFFDENAAWYKKEIKKAAEIIALSGKIVEINTGGIARGATEDVYPSAEMLYHLRKNEAKITISSDAHSVETLDTAFDTAKRTALDAGFKSILYPVSGGWKESPLI